MKRKMAVMAALITVMAVIPLAANISLLKGMLARQTSQTSAPIISQATSTDYSPPENFTFTDTSTGKTVKRSAKSVLYSLVGAAVGEDFLAEEVKALTVAYHTQLCFYENKGTLAIDTSDNDIYLSDENLKKKFGGSFTTLFSHADNVYDRLVMFDGEPKNLNLAQFSTNPIENVEISAAANPYNALTGDYLTEVRVSSDDFVKKIASLNSEADTEAAPRQLIGGAELNSDGSVKMIEIGGAAIDGAELAREFELPSENFTLLYSLDEFLFIVTKSDTADTLTQSAAHFMAEQGNTYDEIITLYCSSLL